MFKVLRKEEEKNIVYLDLIQEQVNNKIRLVACDKNGEIYTDGYILTINPDGTITLHSGVDPILGFKLNGVRSVLIREN